MYEQYGMGQYPFPWGGVIPPPNWQPQTPPMQQSQQGIQGVRFVSGIIMTNYRSEHGDMSHELQEFYDWQRTKTMNCMAEVKVLVDSYK